MCDFAATVDGIAPDTKVAVILLTDQCELVEELGGLLAVLGEATGAERAQVYASLGLRLDYDPYLRRVKATGRPESCRRMCPRGDLNPHAR